MDTSSSGEELLVKTRKPYTITKQRERWTEDEHNRFLEALKLYGRAWQRIEEHIGTKTAVQIRSHAQKFFSKLEREAHAKGIPVCKTLDMDIPPPRPKKRPSNPYPRKMGNGTPILQTGAKDAKLSTSASSSCGKKSLDLEKELPSEKPNGDEEPVKENEHQDEDCSEVLTLLPEVRSSSVSSVNKNSSAPIMAPPRNSCTLREFRPSPQEVSQDDRSKKPSNTEDPSDVHGKSVQCLETDIGHDIIDDQGMQNFARHIPPHILAGISGPNALAPPNLPFQGSSFHPVRHAQGHPNPLMNPASCATAENHPDGPRTIHQAFESFHRDFAPVPHTGDPSTFFNLLVANLLQNPAVYAAASFAASYWPCTNMDSSTDPQMSNQGAYLPSQMRSPSSMAAIAAATVAAATAWWAAHGLLPLCAPFNSNFSCGPQAMAAVPSADIGHAPAAKVDGTEAAYQSADQHSTSKSVAMSSSDSEKSGSTKLKDTLATTKHEDAAAVTTLNNSNKAKSGKQVDRSSCGSNTPSSSDVETEALEKNEKGNDEQKEAEANPQASEFNNRRSRSTNNVSYPRKEVSEEGRLAFQALFSREVLPQSFSLRYELKNKGHQRDDAENKHGDSSARDLSGQTKDSSDGEKKQIPALAKNNDQERLLAIGLSQVKLKARKNGFKPYKRCSMEAKEYSAMTETSEAIEKGPKRIRLESEASA